MNKKYLIKTVEHKEDIDWNNILKEDIAVMSWKGYELYKSYFQICYIKNSSLLIKLTSLESKPWANATIDMGPVYLDSCLEAFLSFDGKRYINLETNSLGVRLQAIGENRYNRIPLIDKNNDGFKVSSKVSDASWSIVIELPLEKICELFVNLKTNDFKSGFMFSGNFYKTGLNPTDKKEHYMSWTNIDTSQPDFHQIQYFGDLEIE